jgi:hypothetical protein
MKDSDNTTTDPAAADVGVHSLDPAPGPSPRSGQRVEHRPTGASLVVVICATVTLAGITVLHVLRSDIDPLHDVMSHYANGSDGPVMSVVFYAFGVSSLALAFRLRTAIDRRGISGTFPYLLGLAGILLITAGVFEVDRPDAAQTIQEVIHSNSAVAAFVLLIVAMLLFSLACWRDDRWWSVRRVSLGLAVLGACAAAGTQLAKGTGYSGAVQRVLAGAVLAWVVLTTVHVRRSSFGAP